jgi:hypothetical protein
METIGSEGEARLIADLGHDIGQVPMGWSYVASGSYRRVFLSPTGVVYKVEMFDGPNEREHEKCARIHQMAEWDSNTQDALKYVEVPRTSLYKVNGRQVIAMPFYRGGPGPDRFAGAVGGWSDEAVEAANFLDLRDLHGQNTRLLDDGRIAVIDLNI